MAFGHKLAGGIVLLVALGTASSAPADAPPPAEGQSVAPQAAVPQDRAAADAAPCTKCLQLALAPTAWALFSPGDNNLYGGLQLSGMYRVAPPDWAVGAVLTGMPASGFLFTGDLLGGWTPFITRSVEPHVLLGPRLFIGNDKMVWGGVLHLGNHIWFSERVGAYVDVDASILFTRQINPGLGGTLGVALRL